MNEFKGNSDERTIELLQQRIDGFKHEFKVDSSNVNGKWVSMAFPESPFFSHVEYRIAKQTRVINGITVPMCMTKKPEVGEGYYAIITAGEYICDNTWLDYEYDNLMLNNGLIFHKESDAKLTMEAILSGTKI